MVAQERCTALHGVPTMFVAMLAAPDFAGGRSPAMPAVGQSRGRLEGNSNTLLPDEADHLGLVGLHLQLVLGVSYGKVTR